MKEQSAEIDGLREQLRSTQQALSQLETRCSGLAEEHNELELLYSRGDGKAQRRIAELEATVTELERDRNNARQEIAKMEEEKADWQTQRADMEKSLGDAAKAWEALGQQEVELKDYVAVKRERDDIHAKLAMALSVTKDAEARAAKAEKQIESLKKKRGKLANGAAKQWEKERSEMESAMMNERAKIDELNARIDLYETNKQVMEATQVKLKAKLDACVSADAAQQELAEAHTATLEQNRKLVADLVAVQGFEGELHSCRAELASMRASLKKEISKKEALQATVTELEAARNTSRKGEGEKGVMLAQLREQVHSWKSKAEKRKEKLASLAKELTIVQQALDKATAQGIQATETAEAHEEDGRMWKLVPAEILPPSHHCIRPRARAPHVCSVLAHFRIIILMPVLLNR
jgi:chromosome segregation ATPase